MKKLIKEIKKICLMIGTFGISVYTKTFAAVGPEPQNLPHPHVIDETPEIDPILVSLNLITSIAFIIGVIIYLKKSSSSITRKIITIIIALAVVVLVCLGINYILTNM